MAESVRACVRACVHAPSLYFPPLYYPPPEVKRASPNRSPSSTQDSRSGAIRQVSLLILLLIRHPINIVTQFGSHTADLRDCTSLVPLQRLEEAADFRIERRETLRLLHAFGHRHFEIGLQLKVGAVQGF